MIGYNSTIPPRLEHPRLDSKKFESCYINVQIIDNCMAIDRSSGI